MASKDSNGLVISLSIFVLLTIGLAVAWYMTWAYSSDVQRQLEQAKAAESGSKGIIQEQIAQLEKLKLLIGQPGEDADDVETAVKPEIAKQAGDASASALSLKDAMIKNATDRDLNIYTSTDRLNQLNTKVNELNLANVKHEEAMKSLAAKVAEKEEELRKKEAEHGELLALKDKQIDAEKAKVREEQDKYTTLQTQTSRQIEELETDIRQKRDALIVLNQLAREQADLSFEREDGYLTFVDQSSLTCYVDLGSRDELRVGTTFSVYKKNNSGVGRRSNADIKGKIEIIRISGDHNSVARIIDQAEADPLAADDPVYSPIFSSGQKLEIAVAGLLDFDGNPGGDRDEFVRLVSGAGATIIIQINDEAKLVDEKGDELTEADPIGSLITEKTRFLIIGDLGEGNATQDSVKQVLYQKMQQQASKMKNAALNHGVHVISLSSFLEYVGYSRKNIAYTPGNKYPGFLSNGGNSESVSSKPRRPASTNGVSAIYAKPGRKPTSSNQGVSKLFMQPSDKD